MNVNKTIVVSSNSSWYLYNFRRNTISRLISEGYKVITVAPKDDYSHKLASVSSLFVSVNINASSTNPIRDAISFFSFLLVYVKYRPQVVLNFTPKNNIYSTLAARFIGARSINNIAGLGSLFLSNGIKSKIARCLYRISQPLAFQIFFQNQDDLQLFNEFNISTNCRIDKIPGSGVDLHRFKPMQAPDDGIVRFLLSARMLLEKGVHIYVAAARQLKYKYGDKVEFKLVGFLNVDNPSAIHQQQMDTWMSEGIINYLGVSDDIENELAEVDCVVLPSFYREGVPKSLLEAAAMGKPIITTDNVGCRETVDDGVNGYICQPRSTKSLVEKLELMINHSHEERLQMGKASREKVVAEFDEQVVIRKYLDVVNECFYK